MNLEGRGGERKEERKKQWKGKDMSVMEKATLST